MNKKYLVIAVLVVMVILGFIYLAQGNEDNSVVEGDIISCLDNAGVVIYGSRTCPACASLAETFGGYVAIGSIYVECSEQRIRCENEKKTGYVPEIQINGEIYNGSRSLSGIAASVNCEI